MKYLIDGNIPIDPKLGGCWRVVDDKGIIYASCYGPSSLLIAQAACEKLNSDFIFEGRIQRATELIIKE